MVVAMLVLPFMDATVKLLSSRYPILQLIWARFFFHFLLVLPFVVIWYGKQTIRAAHPVLLLSPGLFLLVASGLFSLPFSTFLLPMRLPFCLLML